MKVVLLSPLPPPSGGMARWTQLYLSECENCGLNVAVVNTNMSPERASNKDRSFNLFDEIKRSANIINGLRKQIKFDTPDIVHICSPCSRYGLFRDLICLKVAKRIPVVFHCHCNIEDQAKTKLSKFILKLVVNKCKKIIVLNEASKNLIDRMSSNKAVILPNFIEDSKVKAEHHISPHIKSALFVGHVKVRKGITEIFEVARLLPNIDFIIVGPVQELPDNIEKPDNILLVGEVDHEQVSSYLEKADVFFFPSRTEGFANVMLETMSEGLPIIATDVGANRDMIEDQGGIIVPPMDVEAMRAAFIKMYDPGIREKMSKWNVNKVRTSYLIDVVMKRIIYIYGNL